jgi:glycosyltransferase involved in cell wall biosynthesis
MLGGSEVVYFRTAEVLKKHGHQSIFFSMKHPKNLFAETESYFAPFIDLDTQRGLLNYIKASLNVFYSFKTRRHLSDLLDNYRVDITHIHNIHRQMSPSILQELKKRKIPVVMTLHEYKMVCPSFNLLLHEKPCEACAGGKYYNAIRLRCVKDSFLRSALACAEMYLHHKILDIYKNVDVFISPSQFLKNKHREMGFKKEIVYLPNCINVQEFEKFRLKEKDFKNDRVITIVYFGRLYYGKGLYTLLNAVKRLPNIYKKKEITVKIIGDGPMRREMETKVKADGIENIRFLGFLKSEELFREIKNALIVVLPSECYENNPLQVIESFAIGIPVIGARVAGIPELVKDNETGLTFESGNSEDLCSKIEYMINNPDKAIEMGKRAREFVEREMNCEKYYERLIKIYEKAIHLSNKS